MRSFVKTKSLPEAYDFFHDACSISFLNRDFRLVWLVGDLHLSSHTSLGLALICQMHLSFFMYSFYVCYHVFRVIEFEILCFKIAWYF